MLKTDRKWLASINWDAIVEENRKLCPGETAPHRPGKGFEETKKLWESSMAQALPLRGALDLCRRCHDLKPFAFFNGNTFAIIVQKILHDVYSLLPSLEAQILKSTSAHYVAGTVKPGEWESVCDHVYETLAKRASSKPAKA